MPELLAPGTVVGGRYRIRAPLGRGGMGVVYEAEHTSLRRVVALKMLAGEGTDPELVLRFLREARAAAQIGHPGIVDVFDLSTPGEAPFLVMERLRGEDLGQRIRGRELLSLEEVLRIGAALCDAIEAAHASGIIHRDLKPDNVFLARDPASPQPVVKVLDFGIAKLANPGDAGALTEAGSIYGTPAYMAPEQMRSSADVDARADIYSIGAILHEAIAGAPPFSGSTLPELVLNVNSEPPPDLTELRPDAPVSLARLVRRCLSKKPGERPSSAGELGQELRRIGSGVRTPDSPELANAVAETLAGVDSETVAGPSSIGASAAPPPAEAKRTEPAKPTEAAKTSWPKRIAKFVGYSALLMLLLYGGLRAVLAGLDVYRGRERLEAMNAYIADDQSAFMGHLSDRMRGAIEDPELEGDEIVRLYRDLELYLLLTTPRAEGEPGLDDDDEYRIGSFAEAHPRDSGLATPELRRGYAAYLEAIRARYVEVPDDIWAPRDAELVAGARERLAALPENTCAWASLGEDAIEGLPIDAGEHLEVGYTARPLFTREEYARVGGSFNSERLCDTSWVVGRAMLPGPREFFALILREGSVRSSYGETYIREWLRVLGSARWRTPERPDRAALRAFLGAVAQEPSGPLERLGHAVLQEASFSEFLEEDSDEVSPIDPEPAMVRGIEEDLAPLRSALAPAGTFSRYRVIVQELVLLSVEVGEAPLSPEALAQLESLSARTRALIAVQDERYGPFFEAMLWVPVEFARSVLAPEL